jgi:hypothetical protein
MCGTLKGTEEMHTLQANQHQTDQLLSQQLCYKNICQKYFMLMLLLESSCRQLLYLS